MISRRSFLKTVGGASLALGSAALTDSHQKEIAWYLCPYKPRESMRNARYCAMDDLTPEIGTGWIEREITGNRVIVGIDARMASKIGSAFKRLSENEARQADIVEIAAQLKNLPTSQEHAQLLGLWSAVGFGQGWRLPRYVVNPLARQGVEPNSHKVTLAKSLLDFRFVGNAHAAFPTNATVIDNFDRANIGLQPGGDPNWLSPIISGDAHLQIVSQQVGANTGWAGSYYSASTFGPDCECYVDVPTEGTGSGLEICVRIVTPGTAGLDCYFVHSTQGATTFQLWKTLNNSQTQMGATQSRTVDSTDSFGIDAIGSNIGGYHKTAAGSWTTIHTFVNGEVSTAGNMGVIINETSTRIDNFSGGNVVAGGGSTPRLRSLLGVGK